MIETIIAVLVIGVALRFLFNVFCIVLYTVTVSNIHAERKREASAKAAKQ